MSEPTSERLDGPTPNGGTYAVAYFRDATGAPAVKSRAASIEIVEYSPDGDEVSRTYMKNQVVSDTFDRLGIDPTRNI
jgi:hypothetical protein